jgi:hypothetical protein
MATNKKISCFEELNVISGELGYQFFAILVIKNRQKPCVGSGLQSIRCATLLLTNLAFSFDLVIIRRFICNFLVFFYFDFLPHVQDFWLL